MPVYSNISAPKICIHCHAEILQGEHRYFSKQAGMTGLYHWECFVSACRQVNSHGGQLIEEALIDSVLYQNPNTYEVIF